MRLAITGTSCKTETWPHDRMHRHLVESSMSKFVMTRAQWAAMVVLLIPNLIGIVGSISWFVGRPNILPLLCFSLLTVLLTISGALLRTGKAVTTGRFVAATIALSFPLLLVLVIKVFGKTVEPKFSDDTYLRTHDPGF